MSEVERLRKVLGLASMSPRLLDEFMVALSLVDDPELTAFELQGCVRALQSQYHLERVASIRRQMERTTLQDRDGQMLLTPIEDAASLPDARLSH